MTPEEKEGGMVSTGKSLSWARPDYPKSLCTQEPVGPPVDGPLWRETEDCILSTESQLPVPPSGLSCLQ